jgi:Serine-pyruvate aminotransferase/archaeal aspartate aminotransferase
MNLDYEQRILMSVGPVNINYEVLLSSFRSNVGITSDEVNEAFREIISGLRKMANHNKGSIILLPGSGTTAMEGLTNILKKGNRVLLATNGVFGDRWEEILNKYPIEIKTIRSEPGDNVSEEEILSNLESKKFDAIILTHVETSTGVKSKIEVLRKAKDLGVITVLDSVSGFGGEELDIEKNKIDYVVTASQKALGAPPGIGIAFISQESLSIVERGEGVNGYFIDFKKWLPVMSKLEEGKGSYFATPPVHVILALAKAIELCLKEGMSRRIERHQTVAKAIRSGLESLGLKIVAKRGFEANTVTAVYLEGVSPIDFLNIAKQEGVEFASSVHPKIANRSFRIGHMGWVTKNFAILALSVIERTLRRLGKDIEMGRGVRSAQEVFI